MKAIANLLGYQITEELYAGTRTLVYRGIRTSDQLPVVIKILRNEYPSFNELVQFRNQYMIAKNLNSPSIITTYSLEPYKNSYALIMEDFGGISLKQWGIGKTKISMQEFLEIAIALCNTLDILYRERIIHKDIKPANILINPATKEIKLIDFSIASLLPRETQEIQNANSLEGTLAYLSPEQTGRMNRGIDYRSDFYSLGITFYELLTGELPFQSNDLMELVHCHLAQTPVSAHQINPQIPLVLSEITSKLMAKNAEDRYQSALGIKYDLELCLEQLKSTGSIEYFAIGERDLSDRFTIPEKLYGREQEVQALLNAFDRIAGGSPQPPLRRGASEENSPSERGASEEENSPLLKGGGGGSPLSNSELMLVAGFSGIGKTAVINEVHKPIARQRGYFIKGKYDQFQRNIPFSAFVQAFRDLMGQLLSENDAQLQIWKTKILEVVGDNGQVLVDVIPELELIIGEQPPATELTGTAAQNRFNLLIQKFVKIFAGQSHPLVMFIDDLQWADSASLNLLKLLMQDTKYLLILGAYRDNEVSPAHPFMLTVDEIVKTGVVVNTITLQPLSLLDTNYLVADTLNCELLIAQPLTELVYQKTTGNPFFTTQFLKSLYEDRLIKFTPPTSLSSSLGKGGQKGSMGGWQCDISQIRALALTDDVVEFMALQLQRLPSPTQNVLKLAACIGAQFDLQTLAIISEQSVEVAAIELWRALQDGLIIPNTESYKFFIQADRRQGSDVVANPTYRFLHDRVQQAAYSLIPETHKQLTHLKIGRLLLSSLTEASRDQKVLDIVGQLNIGINLIKDLDEQRQLAELNLIAGCKALSATAYAAAERYCQIGLCLLPEDRWQSQYQLTLKLYESCAESAYLNGNFEHMQHCAAIILEQAQTLLDTVKIQIIKIQAYMAQDLSTEAIESGLNFLKQLGINIPVQPKQSDIVINFLKTQLVLRGRKPADLINIPAMRDEKLLAAMLIMGTLVSFTYISHPFLSVLLTYKAIRLSIIYGNTTTSGVLYAVYSISVGAVSGDIERADKFGKLSLKMADDLNDKLIKARSLFVYSCLISHWKYPRLTVLKALKESYLELIETGKISSAVFTVSVYGLVSMFMNPSLSELEVEIANYIEAAKQMKERKSLVLLQGVHQVILELLRNDSKFIGSELQSIDETLNFNLDTISAKNNILCGAYILKAISSYLLEDDIQAVNWIEAAESCLDSNIGAFSWSRFYTFASLIRLRFYPNVRKNKQKQIISQVKVCQAKVKKWATVTPINFLHVFELVEAEKYRVLGKKIKAIELYDRAIAGAKANEYIQEEALANELAAKFYLEWDKEKVAAGYMQGAYYCYAKWGAKAKIQDLETRYPQLLKPILQQPKTSFDALETLTNITNSSIQLSKTSISDSLDFASIIQAAQALSSEIQLDELLKKLSQIILQNSGADKCVLVLPQDAFWKLRAISTPEATEILSESLEDHPNVPTKLIHYVKHTQAMVVVNNLETDLPVIDNYLSQHQPKSVASLPILHQGQLVGILYLKNQSTAGVFTSDRMTVINFLCNQAAISLENARLYANLQASETRFQNLTANVLGAIYQFRLDKDGVGSFNYMSPSCQALYEISSEEILADASTIITTIHPEDITGFQESVAQSAKTLEDWYWEGRYITVSGKLKWLRAASRPWLESDGSVIWDGLVMDVTDRKQAEAIITQKSQDLAQALENLQHTQIQMIQAEKMSALGNLVAGVAHEINNPVGFLGGNIKPALDYINDLFGLLDLYQQQYPQTNPDIQEEIEAIDLEYIRDDLPKLVGSMQEGVKRIQDISTSLRTFSRADTDRPVACNIHDGINSTIMILKHRLKANESRPAIEVIKDYGNLPTIECYAGQLNQVFMNILGNAIDALDESNHGRSYVDITENPNSITITTSLENNYVKIAIADNGKGMSEEVRLKVFDHLFTTKEVGKGTGLGLAIARQIIEEKHRGIIAVESTMGQGTKFSIILPIRK